MADVEIHRDGPVIEIRLNRPAKKNALTTVMYAAIVDGLQTLEGDDELRAAVITAEGTDFCAGNDLSEFVSPPDGPIGGAGFLDVVSTLTKPLVSGVQGKAVGVGATMQLHCDLVYVGSDLDLRFMFVDIGLIPEAGSTLLLPRLIGRARAAEAMLLARPIDAAKAVDWGIANEVVEPALVRDRALEAAHTLAGKPPQALRATKALLRGDTAELTGRISDELKVFRQVLTGPEFTQAAERFLRPRQPAS
jgi:enoyl-CoA hydratase/carnithine racemase